MTWSIPFCCLLLMLLPSKISKGCGPSDFSFKGYSFLLPELTAEDGPYAPYFLKFDQLYENYQQESEVQVDENLAEWQEIFCQLAKVKDIQELIYNTSVEDLETVKTAIKSKNYPLPARLNRNSFARHLERNECNETIDYLIFAKTCEPHVTYQGGWDVPKRDIITMKNLIASGRRMFRKTKSNYIKLRYAYQLIRLAHYVQEYELVLELYDSLLPKTDTKKSILFDWILGHKAGALYHLGEKVEAAYLYALIFQNSKSKRASAYQSFKIQTDEQWKACLLLCQSNQERATLYALRANTEESKAAEEMAEIYQLDPLNPNLELLLVKEMRKLEKDFLGIDFNDKKRDNKRFHKIPRQEANTYLVGLEKFIIQCVKENKVANKELWQLAQGYIEYLSGDLYAANTTFTELSKTIKKPRLKEQLDIFKLAHQITDYDGIDAEEEDEIVEVIKDNPIYKTQADFQDFINDKFAHEYKKAGTPGKAFRCHFNIQDLKPHPQEDIIEDLLELCQKEEKTKFERALITNPDGNSIENDLLDMKGTLLLLEGKPEAALEVLKRIPRNEWDKYQFNPFVDHITDCIECPLEDTIVYNKVTLIERIFELEYKAKSDFEKGPIYYYLLGLAHYNMTYFGNSWKAMDFFRSGGNWEYRKLGIFKHWFFPYGNQENHDCTKALEYFEKARVLTKNRELAARASFMAAKCEQNAYFTSKDCAYTGYRNEIPTPPTEYRKYFGLLKAEYADTEFYQQAIEECKFFKAYAR